MVAMRRRLHQAYLDFKHLTLGVPRLDVRPTDCFITSWPRSGNTWLRYMVFYALYPQREWDLVSIEEQMPIVDRRDLGRALAKLAGQPWRLFKSHEPFQRYYLKGKTAYVVRDGRDAIVSFYHYRTKLTGGNLSWRRFLEESLAGKHRYGSWQDHVAGWLDHDAASVLVVRYEEMLADPRGALKRVLAHFGRGVPDEQVTAAVERSSVDQVNKGFQRYAAEKDKSFSGGLGGGSGRWRRSFSDADLALFNEHAGDVMRRLGYEA
jgi:Sulfotransferase domain